MQKSLEKLFDYEKCKNHRGSLNKYTLNSSIIVFKINLN